MLLLVDSGEVHNRHHTPTGAAQGSGIRHAGAEEERQRTTPYRALAYRACAPNGQIKNPAGDAHRHFSVRGDDLNGQSVPRGRGAH